MLYYLFVEICNSLHSYRYVLKLWYKVRKVLESLPACLMSNPGRVMENE